MSPRVVLVGMPGSGKSSVGRRLAGLIGTQFADSDDLVIEMTGRSVGEIFGRDGEAAFREIEATAIVDALKDFSGVLALGGGAVTTGSVRRALADSGVPVLLLDAGLAELERRLAGTTHRPLLRGDLVARLAELAEARLELYREVATGVVPTDGLDVPEVASAAERQLTAADSGRRPA